MKMRKEEQEIQNHCTFKPEISEVSKKIAQEYKTEKKEAHERLYENAIDKAKTK